MRPIYYRYFGLDNYGNEFERFGCNHKEEMDGHVKILLVYDENDVVETPVRNVLSWEREICEDLPPSCIFQ
jgi:hypothetical protein